MIRYKSSSNASPFRDKWSGRVEISVLENGNQSARGAKPSTGNAPMAFLRVPCGLKAGRKPEKTYRGARFSRVSFITNSQTNAAIKAAATGGMPAAAVLMRLSEVNPGAERETASVFGRRNLIKVGGIDMEVGVDEDGMV